MKKICAVLTLAASILSASPLEVAIKKRSERELVKKETFIRQQNHLRSALGWDSPTTGSRLTRSGTASVAGKIGHNIDGHVSYSVFLYDEFGYEVDENYSSTDSFSFENLYPGKYTYKISSYNYPQKWYGNVSNGTDAQFLTIANGQAAEFDSMFIEWQEPSIDSMIIYGTMTKEGAPYANANINLVYNLDEGGSSSHSSRTDENGNYEIAITGKSGDNCHILVRAYTYDEPNTIPLWIDGSPINEKCPTVTFTDSLKADLAYVSGGTISGKIVAGLTEFNSVSISAFSKEGYQFGSGGSNSNDSTYTISGLPDGEYYLRFGDYFTYKEEFYPNTTNHEDAQLIFVRKGAVTNIDATVSEKDGDSGDGKEESVYIKGSVVDSKGNPVIVEYATIDYGLSGHSSSCNSSTFLVSAYADTSFKVTVVINDIYLTKAYWENGKDTSLTTGDTLEVLITLPEAGSIAGTFPLIENVDTSRDISFGTSILITAESDTMSAYIKDAIPGKYRIPSVPAGTYSLSTVPVVMNESGKSLSQKPSGAIQTAPLSVTVNNRETSVQNITGTPASGMISGTYTFDGAAAEWIYYAIRPDGSIASLGMAYIEDDALATDGDYHGLLPRNWDIWSSQQQTGTLPITIKGNIDIPLLTSGDYYIFLGYWDESLDEDDDDILKGIWYGQDTPVKVTMDSVFLDELGAIIIPSDAEKINLTANDTWVKGINFGSTGILQKMHSSHSQNLVVATKSNLSLQHLSSGSFVELFTLSGRRVIHKELGAVNSSIIKHSLASGTYLLKITSESGRKIQKIRIP